MTETTASPGPASISPATALLLFGGFLPFTLLFPEMCPASDSSRAAPHWIDQVTEYLEEPLASVEEFAEVRWQELANRMGFRQPRYIAAYRGYGNDDTLWIRGRLLSNKPYGGPQEDDGWWDNLKATYERWESDEIAGADIRLTYVDQSQTVTTDADGYYSAEFTVDPDYPRTAAVMAEHRMENEVLSARHDIMILDPSALYVVISDVDDTVIHTGITNLLTSARLTFLHNARTRKPLLGVGALYRHLASPQTGGIINPVLYVSNSAWNMYDLLRDFIDLNGLPPGPLQLRDLGLGTDSSDHKIETIIRMTERYDPLPVILVGDSGQHDAEIYTRVAERFPDRVEAIYIRDVDPTSTSEHDEKVDRLIARYEYLDTAFLRVSDSAEIARHLQQLNILNAAAVSAIEKAVDADRKRETLAEEVMNGKDRGNDRD